MRNALHLAIVAAAVLAPQWAFAQMPLPEPVLVIPEPVIVEEPGYLVERPMAVGPLVEDDALDIALMNGLVEVDDVEQRWLDGNFEVDGVDRSGNDVEMTIDGETGEVLSIND